jgi:hypothetical protein
MLKIRREQEAAMDEVAVRNFENRAIEHIRGAFPKHCSFLKGEEQQREVVRYGFERAKRYDLTTEENVLLFIDLMFLLGRSFDTDVQLPWASEILNDQVDQTGKAGRLHTRAMEYLDRVSGPNNEFIDEAQRRIHKEKLDHLVGLSIENFESHLIMRLRIIFPQKCQYVGEDGLRRLIQQGVSSAQQYQIASLPGAAIYIALMFMLGVGFDTDPLFAWAANVLNDPEIHDEKTRVQSLYRAGIKYLEQWCV